MKNWWKKWHKYRQLPPDEQRAAWKLLAGLLFFKGVLLALPFEKSRKLFHWLLTKQPTEQTPINQLKKTATLTSSVAGSVPLGLTCLPQALAFTHFFKHERGLKIVLGVRAVAPEVFEFHAWAEKDGEIVIGEITDAEFQALSEF